MIIFAYWLIVGIHYFGLITVGSLILLATGALLLTDEDPRQKTIVGLHLFFLGLIQSFFNPIPNIPFLVITLPLLFLSLWTARFPILKTSTLNNDNIQLAFYKGKHTTWKMRLGCLCDIPFITSCCVVGGNNALRIKNGYFRIVMADSVRLSPNYYVIDTGIPISEDFVKFMKSFDWKKKSMTTSPCIATIRQLLGFIGPEYKPTNWLHYVPGVYLRKCLKNGRAK